MFVCHHWKIFDRILFLPLQTMSQKHQKTLSKQLLGLWHILGFLLNLKCKRTVKIQSDNHETIYVLFDSYEQRILVLFTICSNRR